MNKKQIGKAIRRAARGGAQVIIPVTSERHFNKVKLLLPDELRKKFRLCKLL